MEDEPLVESNRSDRYASFLILPWSCVPNTSIRLLAATFPFCKGVRGFFLNSHGSFVVLFQSYSQSLVPRFVVTIRNHSVGEQQHPS